MFVFSPVIKYRQHPDTHHDVLLDDVWVFTHRLYEEHLREEEIQKQIKNCQRNTTHQNHLPTSYLKATLLCKLDDGFPSFSGRVCGIKNLMKMDKT